MIGWRSSLRPWANPVAWILLRPIRLEGPEQFGQPADGIDHRARRLGHARRLVGAESGLVHEQQAAGRARAVRAGEGKFEVKGLWSFGMLLLLY